VILAGVAGVIVVGLIILVLSGAFSSGDEEEVPGVAEATRPLAPTTAAGGAIQPPAAGEGDTELPPLEPDSPAMEELMAQVNQAYMEDDLHRALVLLDEGIARAPVFAELFCQRGNVLRDLEALGEAAASFEHCLALAEEQGLSELRIDARGLLAITQTRQAMLEQEDPDLALAVMNEALADPYSPTWLYCERAELLVEFGDRSAAIEDYEACRAGDQGDQYWLTRLYEVKGGLSLDEEDYGAAADLFTAWSELEPHTPWPFCYLGEALTGLAEFGQAIGAFERCRELSTEDEDAAQWASTGIFAAQAYEAESAEEWLAALEAFDQAIGISSDEAWLHCERGRILMQLDALDEARHSLQACLEMSGDDAQARESAETLLQELGDRLP
jgi:tetratricopeptide (TPR) repeat protein